MNLKTIQQSYDELEFLLRQIDSVMIAIPYDCIWMIEGEGSDFPKYFVEINSFIGTKGLVAIIDDSRRLWTAENYLTLVIDLIYSDGSFPVCVTEDTGYQRARRNFRQEYETALKNHAEATVSDS